jgi:hypothetical protein
MGIKKFVLQELNGDNPSIESGDAKTEMRTFLWRPNEF